MKDPDDFPTVSVIIPSLAGDQENLNRLKQAVLASGLPEDRLEIIAAVGVSPNGRARDRAAPHASGKYLICMDADVSFPEPGALREVIEFLENHPEVGLAGPAQQLPDDLPPKLERRARQMPRSHVEVVDEFIETDMVTHACLALERELFMSLGMEHPNLISGTDPDLRNRVRERGLKVGLVPGTRVFHPPVKTWSELLRTNFDGGRRSRWVKNNYPDYFLNAEPDVTDRTEARRTGFRDRIFRHLSLLFSRLTGGEFWGLSAQFVYLLGHLWQLVRPCDWVEEIPYPEPPGPDHPDWPEFLEALEEEGKLRWLHEFGKAGDDSDNG